jgi:DNA-binding LacI/PurR family transcriptional regulator
MNNFSKNCTLKDIANYAGVNKSTVSRVLNNNTSPIIPVTQKTRDKIHNAVKKLNYTPNSNAKKLAGSKSNTIALVVPSVRANRGGLFSSNLFMPMLLGYLEPVLIRLNLRLLLIFRNEDFIKKREYIGLFKENSIDAMLIWGATQNDSYIKELDEYLVLQCGQYYSMDTNAGYVGYDYFKGGAEVTEHLLRAGRKKLACVWGPSFSSGANNYRLGVESVLAKNGIKPTLELQANTFSGDESIIVMRKLIAEGRHTEFDGMIFSSSGLAIGAIKAAEEHGIAVPKQIAFTGSGGTIDYAEKIITFDTQDMHLAEKTIDGLVEMLQKDKKIINILDVNMKIPSQIPRI